MCGTRLSLESPHSYIKPNNQAHTHTQQCTYDDVRCVCIDVVIDPLSSLSSSLHVFEEPENPIPCICSSGVRVCVCVRTFGFTSSRNCVLNIEEVRPSTKRVWISFAQADQPGAFPLDVQQNVCDYTSYRSHRRVRCVNTTTTQHTTTSGRAEKSNENV